MNAPAIRYGSARTAAPGVSLRTLATIVAAHVGALFLLVAHDIVPVPQTIRTLVVDIIRPETPTPPQKITEPQARPVDLKPAPRRSTPQPTPAPVLAAETANAAEAVAAPAVRDAPPPAPPAAPSASQPRFDADYLSNPAPTYPPLSRRMGEEGKVVLRVLVEPAGRPSQIELKSSSGSQRLDQAAQDAVWRWKFIPAMRGDEAVAAWVLVPVVFTLKS